MCALASSHSRCVCVYIFFVPVDGCILNRTNFGIVAAVCSTGVYIQLIVRSEYHLRPVTETIGVGDVRKGEERGGNGGKTKQQKVHFMPGENSTRVNDDIKIIGKRKSTQ